MSPPIKMLITCLYNYNLPPPDSSQSFSHSNSLPYRTPVLQEEWLFCGCLCLWLGRRTGPYTSQLVNGPEGSGWLQMSLGTHLKPSCPDSIGKAHFPELSEDPLIHALESPVDLSSFSNRCLCVMHEEKLCFSEPSVFWLLSLLYILGWDDP